MSEGRKLREALDKLKRQYAARNTEALALLEVDGSCECEECDALRTQRELYSEFVARLEIIAEASQRSETGARELTPRECFETYRNLVWTVQEADGMNRGWVEFARRLNEIVQFRPTQAGSETPAPAK